MEMQTAPSFGRTDSIVIPFPGQPAESLASRPQDNPSDSPRTESGRTYTFKQAAELLECGDESTLRNRYWKQKVEPAFRHCPTPLQSIAKYDTNGNPIYRLNETAIEVLRAFLTAKAEGRDDAFLMAAREQFPAPLPPNQQEAQSQPQREINVETKAAIVVDTPALPQTYSLAALTGEAIEINDPMALATQIVQAIDHVQTAMQTDIERKEQKLNETRKAKEIVSNKVQELKLDQRFYQEKNSQLSQSQTSDTQALQELAAFMQALGKPPAASPAG
ncbi:hypothetical protein H6F67_21205 [Microcoleus sp. FACHB-1515]|uniref:hypothetical protein n=1 Tax=Cyanophyceae TaxID=3028117 RepID=UPI001686B83C|nr:hypothetical protein [Microcoleus sp. FACHB-1515]MBD2092371.1 hypothetical protein [Microcoleus sp. FACHB-1515]